jgi:transcriptional regulator with XRE-family HTH domain
MFIIKKLRLQKGWSQAELAEFSGLSIRTIQRIENGENPGLETLKSLAAVFDMDVSEIQKEYTMEESTASKEEKWAFEQVKREKRFYKQLISYICVIGMLLIVNLVVTPHRPWIIWPATGWGIGLVMQAVRVFMAGSFLGPEWEKKQIEKKLGRKL